MPGFRSIRQLPILGLLVAAALPAAAQTVDFSSTVFSAREGDAELRVTVQRSGPATQAVQVDYTTATSSSATAQPGEDYALTLGTLSWAAGETTPREIVIPLVDNLGFEGLEDFDVTLSYQEAGGAHQRRTAAYILDDDGPALRSRLRFDRPHYAIGDCVQVKLDDPDENRDPLTAEVLEVHVGSFAPTANATDDLETFQVKETAEDSGIFESVQCLRAVEGAATAQNGFLDVARGNVISAFYVDPNTPSNPQTFEQLDGAADTAVILGGQAGGGFTWQLDPEILDPRLRFGDPADPNEPTRPNAVVVDAAGGMPMAFGTDQVVLQPGTPEDLVEFLQQYQGTVVEAIAPLDPTPQNFSESYFVVRVDIQQVPVSELDYLMELNAVEGNFTFSSLDGARLASLVTIELLGGRAITHNPLGWLNGRPFTVEQGGVSAFDDTCNGDANWFRLPQIGVDRAVLALDLADRNQARSVRAAVIDGGFARPSDYTPFNGGDGGQLDYGESFASLTQGDCTNRNCTGSASGTNPLPCSGTSGCPWHGTGAFSVMGAVADNGYGAMGVAGHGREPNGTDGDHALVDPMLYRAGFPYMTTVARGLRQARLDGAQIINVSSGFPCKPLNLNICDGTTRAAISIACSAVGRIVGAVIPPLGIVIELVGCNGIRALLAVSGVADFDALEAEVANAVAADIVITASGPQNITLPVIGSLGGFNAPDVQMAPCFLPGVVCVGGTNATLTPQSSTAGGAIDVWAPDQSLVATPTPANAVPLTRDCFSGTSGAAPFVAGVAALIRAADPSMSAATVRSLLSSTSRPLSTPASPCDAHPSIPGACNGLVDAAAAVEAALGPQSCTGWDENDVRDDFDTPAQPEVITPASFAGGTITLDANRAIHATGATDEDWFRFQAPDLGTPSTRMTFVLTLDDHQDGPLILELYRNLGGTWPSPGDLIEADQTEPQPFPRPGDPSSAGIYRRLLFSGRTYYLRVRPADPATQSDTCYTSGLTITTVEPGPDADPYESNDNLDEAFPIPLPLWEHDPHDPRLFEHDIDTPFEGFGPGDLWTLTLEGLSLHDLTDTDWYRIPLPDPSATYPDVDPDPGVVEPLVECKMYERRSGDPGEIDSIPAGGFLRMEIRSGARDEPFNIVDPPYSGLARAYNVRCPRADLGLSEVLFSYGDRPDPRDQAQTYEVRMYYSVPVNRLGNRIPARPFSALPCANGVFPDCERLDAIAATFETKHGWTFIDPNCLADGCPEDYIFEWDGDPGRPFDVLFSDVAGLSYELRTLEGDLIATSEPFFGGGVPGDDFFGDGDPGDGGFGASGSPEADAGGEAGGLADVARQHASVAASILGGSGAPIQTQRLTVDMGPDTYILTVTGPEGDFVTTLVDGGVPLSGGVELVPAGSTASFSWPPVADADAYDVVRGDLRELSDQQGDFAAVNLVCLSQEMPDTQLDDGEEPQPGESWFYLVRPSASGLKGSWDSGGAAQRVSRDPGLRDSACP